ncbi:MAG TPA: histidine phosphatase family protein [Pseudonocardiaceae bacterium]|jgi:broad specificity phosphatase PhoE|nr:histidine phosphatase family protein [Pseudonocardiaceae bacterium]
MAELARRDLLRTLAVGGVAVAAGTVLGELPANATKAPQTTTAAQAGDALIMIVRHAEKPTDSGKPYGVTPDGTKDDHSLTVTGWTRAGALVELFAPDNGVLPAGLRTPDRIYASGAGEKGQRPIQTVTPLAAKLNYDLDTDYGEGDEKDLAAEIVTLSRTTLVSWEHEHIPTIVAALGTVTPAPPSSWPDERFDMVWVFAGGPSSWTFSQVPQLLLAGDSSTPL